MGHLIKAPHLVLLRQEVGLVISARKGEQQQLVGHMTVLPQNCRQHLCMQHYSLSTIYLCPNVCL